MSPYRRRLWVYRVGRNWIVWGFVWCHQFVAGYRLSRSCIFWQEGVCFGCHCAGWLNGPWDRIRALRSVHPNYDWFRNLVGCARLEWWYCRRWLLARISLVCCSCTRVVGRWVNWFEYVDRGHRIDALFFGRFGFHSLNYLRCHR